MLLSCLPSSSKSTSRVPLNAVWAPPFDAIARSSGLGTVAKPKLRRLDWNGNADGALKGTREVEFDELGRHESGIYERSRLGAGAELEGAAIVEEPAATTVVFPGQTLRVDLYGNLIIETGV